MRTSPAVDEPIIVVGCFRSGTTLFRLMLDHHPDINIFGEFEEAVAYLDNQGWPEVDDYVNWLRTRRAFVSRKFVIGNFNEYPELVRDFMRQAYERTDKRFVGALIHSRFDRCPDIWPNARYIHVLRDHRDVARSCIGMGWVGNTYYGAKFWVKAQQRWDRLVELTAPENRIQIRYEELVADPVTVLTTVCEFVGVEYDTQMLSYHLDSPYSPPDSSLAEQWRSKLSSREIRNVEYRCGALLETRGYQRNWPDLPAPKHLDRIYLYLENRLKHARSNVNRYGVILWLCLKLMKVMGIDSAKARTKLIHGLRKAGLPE